ncbi:DUF4913 domain-containing protein [Streptomyces sp. S1A]|uniref:DUF4913 domain-containing protein n=1 Tax=Streptomyces sp. ICN903 TaxID=2964654 RepID=UPI001EDBDECF|nr:DUF4913 domain-containing protein [Streptomyces sp. ICN903]MCG3042827.1 DUF4913 domain-containing protein [Streptomyces sp. ICN903]
MGVKLPGLCQNARTVVSALRDEKVLAWVTLDEHRPRFDTENFATSRDTLYLLSKKGGPASAVVAALADAVFTGGAEAGERHGGRLPEPMRALIEWVEGVLVPGYLAEPSADARWCHLWFEHPPAVARLHACWLAWQELTDPATCGYTGPSVWHRDHLDPCIRELRASSGPFAGCTKGEHQIDHRMPGTVPSAWTRTGD